MWRFALINLKGLFPHPFLYCNTLKWNSVSNYDNKHFNQSWGSLKDLSIWRIFRALKRMKLLPSMALILHVHAWWKDRSDKSRGNYLFFSSSLFQPTFIVIISMDTVSSETPLFDSPGEQPAPWITWPKPATFKVCPLTPAVRALESQENHLWFGSHFHVYYSAWRDKNVRALHRWRATSWRQHGGVVVSAVTARLKCFQLKSWLEPVGVRLFSGWSGFFLQSEHACWADWWLWIHRRRECFLSQREAGPRTSNH